MQEMQVWSLGQEGPLEKEMAAHSNILAWEMLWTEELGWTWRSDQTITTIFNRTFCHTCWHPWILLTFNWGSHQLFIEGRSNFDPISFSYKILSPHKFSSSVTSKNKWIILSGFPPVEVLLKVWSEQLRKYKQLG